MKPRIYLDNAATTPMLCEAMLAMSPYYMDQFYNPSSRYGEAYNVSNVIRSCRERISETINCKPKEIYFTSGGSESDNWALRCANQGDHIITSKIEHHAILNTCKYLEQCGVEVTYVDVDENGFVNVEDIENAIKDNTVLISIMMANNEIGTIQQIGEIAKIAKKNNVYMHTDAVQAYGHIEINVDKIDIDMMSVSAHKFGGPKGVGFLYMRNGVELSPLIYGGYQQFGKRAGTENVAGIVGMTTAAEISYHNIKENESYIKELTSYLADGISKIGGVRLNGDPTQRLSNNLNYSFVGVRGEQLLTLLSDNGICVSTGSACNSASTEPSHVLKAIGLSDDDANSSIRFTVSVNNTKEEIDYTIRVLKQSVEQLRRIKNG